MRRSRAFGRTPAGGFAGLAAGQAYSAPARTYYRDGYWTMQALLPLAPEAVKDEIRMLAAGVQPDGEAPSGVILSGPAQSRAWADFVRYPNRFPDRYREDHRRPGDWWSDHFDSPLFFILAIGDYVRTTGDTAEAREHWPAVRAIVARYLGFAAGGALPLKPRNDRDWADNVYREGLVAYDLGLFVGALDVVAALGRTLDAELSEQAKAAAAAARKAIDDTLWVEARNGYADYRTPDGFIEDHLTLDSLTLARFDAISPDKAKRLLLAVEASLESRNNAAQPYGDWGVLCAYPPFKRPADLRAKSAFAYRYHNGSDWPYWDGVYAEERLRRGSGRRSLRTHSLVGDMSRQRLGWRCRIFLAAVRTRLAAPGLERHAGGRRAEIRARYDRNRTPKITFPSRLMSSRPRCR